MKKGIKKLGENLLKFGKKKSPEILAVLAIAGLFKTAYDSMKAGPEAKKIIEETKIEYKRAENRNDKVKVAKDTTKKMVKVMLPVVIDTTLTTTAIISSNRISNKRIALLSAAYKISEKSLDDMNKKVRELLGDKKANEIRQSIAKDKFKKEYPKHENDKIIIAGDGNVVCMDLYSKQKFYSNAQEIGAIINKISARCMTEMYITLNELYDELGIESRRFGEDIGFNVDDLIEGQLPIYIDAQLDDHGQPVLTIDYSPRFDPHKKFI